MLCDPIVCNRFLNVQIPTQHPISKSLQEEFIQRCDVSVQEAMQKLLDNTLYVSYESFHTRLKKMVMNLCETTDQSTIHFYRSEKTAKKSNAWVLGIVVEIISNSYPTMQIKYVSDSDFEDSRNTGTLTNHNTVVFVDDCLYSGAQMAHCLLWLQNAKMLELVLYVLVPYATTSGLKFVQDSFLRNGAVNKLCSLHFGWKSMYELTQSTSEILNWKERELIRDMYADFFQVNKKYLIYFDHKIADYVSSLPLVYSGLIANQHNKKTLQLIEKNLLEDDNEERENMQNMLKRQLEYCCFITECNNTRNFSQSKPNVILPPYVS